MIIVSPQLNPVALQLGPLAIHWYGIAYLFGFLGLRWFLRRQGQALPFQVHLLDDLLFYALWGVLLGGRIGYMVFYQTQWLIAQPLELLYLWHGGMSFHGAFIGASLGLKRFASKHKLALMDLTDVIVPWVPITLGVGRIANWVNGELWGRPTHADWGMIYPWVDQQLRYPSQLIECFLEGFLLFVVLCCFKIRCRASGQLTALFIILYALCRLVAECFRAPDPQLGFLLMGQVTMGQILSFVMLFFGFVLCWRAGRRSKAALVS